MSLNTYWGDMHTQFNLAHMRLQTQGVDAVAEPPDDASDCEAFVRQAFEGAREYIDFFRDFFGTLVGVPMQPRTFGVELAYHF